MQTYKAPDNSLHCIEPEFFDMLPPGCIPITDEEAEALRPKPDAKAVAIAEIDKQRDAAIAAGITHNGAQYHSDAIFQSQLQAFLLAWETGILPAGATVAIRRKDNTTVQMSRAEVTALAAAVMAHVQSVYAASWVAKDTMP